VSALPPTGWHAAFEGNAFGSASLLREIDRETNIREIVK
jgi:hypothetical protein